MIKSASLINFVFLAVSVEAKHRAERSQRVADAVLREPRCEHSSSRNREAWLVGSNIQRQKAHQEVTLKAIQCATINLIFSTASSRT